MRVVTVATDDALARRIRDVLAPGARTVTTVAPDDALEVIEDTTAVVVIDGCKDVDRALSLARQVERRHPEVSVLLSAVDGIATLNAAMRAGVREVLSPSASPSTVRDALGRAIERADRRVTERSEVIDAHHRLIVVVSPKGGAGKTMLASNLAVGLSAHAPKQVVLVDGDLQFGDVANALRLLPETGVREAVTGGLGDVAEVKVHLTPHRSGAFALCAPEDPAVADEISPAAFATAVRLLARSFPYVVVDTEPGLGERTLGVMDHATDLVFVAATDVASIRGFRKAIEVLDRIGMTGQTRHLVLNRADARVGLERADIIDALGMEPDIEVPSDRSLPIALNRGVPVLEADDRSPARPALTALVDRFAPGDLVGAVAARANGHGRRWWKR